MPRRRDPSNLARLDDPPPQALAALEIMRARFGEDREGFEEWRAAYAASGWRSPPVRRLRVRA